MVVLKLIGLILVISCEIGMCSNMECHRNFVCISSIECKNVDSNQITLLPCNNSNDTKKICCPNVRSTTKRTVLKNEPFNTIRYSSYNYETSTVEYEKNFLYTSEFRSTTATTPKNGKRNFTDVRMNERIFENLFRNSCGLATVHNRITGGKVAEFGQFPWMALLGFKFGNSKIQFLCGGTLITQRHVLTAAHCISENRPLELISVRLGEFNLTSEIDCEQFGDEKICIDRYVDKRVRNVDVHSGYDQKTLKNDIAIIELQGDVRESDYIRTICLPFNRTISKSDLIGRNFTVSGWGKTSSSKLFGSDVLQFAKVQIWDTRKCNETIPREVKPLNDKQLCANGQTSEDACKGDSGGPLIDITTDYDKETRNYQIGIVSFGTSTCGDKNLPTIYTRVDQYLDWIINKVL